MVLDRFFKNLALYLGGGTKIKILGDWLSFNLAKNQYIAFSLPLTGIILNIFIGIIILIILIYLLKLVKNKEYCLSSLLTILLFSAINNYYDRLRYGYIIDYLDIKYFTVLNISDLLISISTIGLIILIFRLKEKEKNLG